MNCRAVQHRLLLSETPDQPGDELLVHLQACAACRQWHQRLLRLEQAVPLIPVPASTARRRVLRQVLSTPAVPAGRVPPVPKIHAGWLTRLSPVAAWSWWHRQDPQRRALATGSLAAGLLFVALVAMLWGPEQPPVTTTAK